MPFAPSILDKTSASLIDNPKGLRSPHMVLAFNSLKTARVDLQAAMHPYDYTVRPQIVEKGGDYWQVLDEWRSRTGYGGVLNTSFNRHGWPIVRNWQDALWTLENTGLKHLVIDEYVIVKE